MKYFSSFGQNFREIAVISSFFRFEAQKMAKFEIQSQKRKNIFVSSIVKEKKKILEKYCNWNF